MAKRVNNSYKSLDISQVKEELNKNIRFLSSVDITSISDDIEWETDFRGIQTPKVETSIEQKIETYILNVKDSIEQIQYIINQEKEVSLEVNEKLDIIQEHLSIVKNHIDSLNPNDITPRFFTMWLTSKKGVPYEVKKIAANKTKQHTFRQKIGKIVRELDPIIESIKENRKGSSLQRGGKQIPISVYRKYRK